MTEPLVYLNGRMLPASQAHLKIYDAGFVWSATVTEQLRTFHQRLYKLDEHLDRLHRSLRPLRLDLPVSREELANVTQELVRHHAGLVGPGVEFGLILFVTPGEHAAYAGSAELHAGPTICVHTFPLRFERWERALEMGIHLVTPSTRQLPVQCCDPKMKARSRLHYYLAEKEAQLVDPAATALLLDLEGNVTETATANLLMVAGGTILSPPPDHILSGISRGTVMALAEQQGIPFQARTLQVFDVLNAEEAFLSSTPYCLLPVTKVNGIALGAGKPGPIFRRLLQAWSAEVGLDIAQQIRASINRDSTTA